MHSVPLSISLYVTARNRKSGPRVIRVSSREAPVTFFHGAETHSRSVLKAISWRALGTLDTFAISWFMTGRVEIAGSIAATEVVTKIGWYYLHERIWAIVPWGRREYGRAV